MKTERRHELQTNDLAVWLTKAIEKLGPYKNLVFGGAVILVVAIGLVSYLSGMNVKKQSQAWSNYFEIALSATDADTAGENLETVANAFSGTEAGLWAMNSAGMSYLNAAGDEVFTDRVGAEKKLQSAVDAFQLVLKQASDPLLRQRALMGLAQSQESLGDFDNAVKSYQEVATKYPNSIFKSMADERVVTLEDPSTREWYEWFAKQEPAKPMLDPSLFENMQNLPRDPNIPEPGNLIRPDGSPPPNSTDLQNPINSPIVPADDSDIFDEVDPAASEDSTKKPDTTESTTENEATKTSEKPDDSASDDSGSTDAEGTGTDNEESSSAAEENTEPSPVESGDDSK